MRTHKVELLALDTIQPYPRNARIHHEANVLKIAASIKEFGWTAPILVDEQNIVLAGHGRLLAARTLGLEQAPCIRLEGLSAAQKRAYRLADNRLTFDADWDMEALKLELGELDAELMAIAGFDPKELDDILGRTAPQEGEDDTPALQEQAVSKPGEIWALRAHRLICADACSAAEVARLLGGVTPSVMVTDPPYGVDYEPGWRHAAGVNKSKRLGQVVNDQRSDWREAWALFHGPVAYVWHGALQASSVWESLLVCSFEIRAQIIWQKESLVIGRGHYHWQHEPCWYAVRKAATNVWIGDRKQTTLWQVGYQNTNPENEEQTHGTQKPVELMRRPIVNHTSEGQAVYDPFMGSGTTLIAAETTGRIAYGCEINPLYIDMAIRRWQSFTGKIATRLGDGRTFIELEAEATRESPAGPRTEADAGVFEENETFIERI